MCKAEASALFDRLWELCQVKKSKGQVSLTAKQRLLKVGYDEMARAIDRYKAELEKDSDRRRPQNSSTFFNSGYVDYLDADYVPGKTVQAQKDGGGKFGYTSGNDTKNSRDTYAEEFVRMFGD